MHYPEGMPSPEELRQRIENGIPGACAEVRSVDGVHFDAVVTAPSFDGMSRIERHRLVYGLFENGELGGAIHALSLKTETP